METMFNEAEIRTAERAFHHFVAQGGRWSVACDTGTSGCWVRC